MVAEPKANTSAEVVLHWGGIRALFALKGRQIEHFEKACGPIQDAFTRLMTGHASYTDIRLTVELGLEGGGMPPVLVQESMSRWFDGQPLANPRDPSSPLATAQAVMMAAWVGMEDLDQSGEARAGESPASSPSRRGARNGSTAARTPHTSKPTRSTKSSRRGKS